MEVKPELSDEDIEQRFYREMLSIYERAKTECKYNATRFLGMVSGKGGLRTAKYLLHEEKVSDGFTALWECDRLDLTVEAVVLQKPWRSLFTPEELDIAQKRLQELGYSMLGE